MGNKVQQLVEAGLRRFWFAGAASRDIGDRLAAAVGREHGAGKELVKVRRFDGLRAVSVTRRVTARNGVPTTRFGQRVVGPIVRGNGIFG